MIIHAAPAPSKADSGACHAVKSVRLPPSPADESDIMGCRKEGWLGGGVGVCTLIGIRTARFEVSELHLCAATVGGIDWLVD